MTVPGEARTRELWLDQRQIIFRSRPRPDVTLAGVMNEPGDDGWELVTDSQPCTGYHGGRYTFKRERTRSSGFIGEAHIRTGTTKPHDTSRRREPKGFLEYNPQ